MSYLLEYPSLISVDLESQLKEIVFLFELYHGISQEDTMKIFQAFPYMLCVKPRKIQRFLGEFRKYRYTQAQIMNVCMNSQGLLGSKVSNFVGLYDTMRLYGIKASEVTKILDILPEFALQNRRDLLRRKIDLIKRESGKDDIYIRNFIKRHPDVVMKSYASLEAKISYFQRNLNR